MLGLGKLLTLEKLAEGVTFTNTKSVTFNGTNQGIDTSYGVDAAVRGSFTFSMWVKPADGVPLVTGIFMSTLPTATPFFVLALSLSNTGKLSFQFGIDSDQHTEASTSAIFSDGAASSWSHLAFVWTRVGDSDPGTVDIYVNGSAIATQTVLGNGGITGSEQDGATFTGSGQFNIGYMDTLNVTPISFYDGEMDELAFFREALSASGISEIYNSGVPTDLTLGGSNFSATNLELYYRFEDDFTDTTGTSDGTGVNSPTFTTDVPE